MNTAIHTAKKSSFMAADTVSKLGADKLAKINGFLDAANEGIFTADQISFLNGLQAHDPLGLKNDLSTLRGHFADFGLSLSSTGMDERGKSFDEKLDEYLKGCREAKITPCSKSVEDKKAAIARTIAQHGVLLETGSSDRSKILYLNSAYEPVFLKELHFLIF